MPKGIHTNHARGEKCSWSKLTSHAVKIIRASGEGVNALASRFEVSRGTIADVLMKRAWRETE
jgi:hypothetical protein